MLSVNSVGHIHILRLTALAWGCHHLGFNIGKLSCLFSCLRKEVGAHFQHGCCVVVDCALLQLGHFCLHAFFDVVLNLQNNGEN